MLQSTWVGQRVFIQIFKFVKEYQIVKQAISYIYRNIAYYFKQAISYIYRNIAYYF